MYRPIPKIPDLPAIERHILELWNEKRVFDRLRKQNAGGEPWSFLDGPITANNPMGVHHAWGRSYKDMFQRYHAMRGRELRYQNGFDCQGLWVEVEVEKALGLADRTEIEEYGLENFVKRCKERVLTFAARQTEQSIRLGYWTDWDSPETLLKLRDALKEGLSEVTITTASGREVTGSPEDLIGRLGSPEFGGSYFTFSDENNYTIWRFLEKCHEGGYLYRGTDNMPWCCRCGTGLSQMEVAEGRKITRHTSVFVRFPLVGQDKKALLVWTTTPWTLSSNVAAAVNPEMTYLEVRHGEWTYYLGKENYERDRVQNLEAAGHRESHKLQSLHALLKGSGTTEVLRELQGEELVGLAFHGPFDHFEAQQRPGGLNAYGAGPSDKSSVESHRVIPWSDVSGAEGTGIVHIAPGCGAEDGRLGEEFDLPVIAPLAPDGTYLEGFGALSGRSVHDVADFIVQDLRERGLLLGKESYPHVYPHCWRCKEELVFRLVDEWFIKMEWRDRIQRIVGDIRWIPKEGEAREQDWLKNMGDWMISKKRFWGLALPIWVCDDCDHFTVVGGREELRERTVEGWEQFDGHSPHRPFIDKIVLRCDQCGGTCRRIPDVGNPWLDAGIVSFSTLRYNTDREYWERWFPADFVVESFPGQFRNWFYALLAMSTMMSDRAPFKTLLGHALVHDARGEEMHKSAGNSIAFDEAAEVLGAELMRYMYASRNPVQNLNFPDLEDHGDHGNRAQVEIRRRLLTLWNCYSFFVTYARVDGWRPESGRKAEVGDLDRWILSRLERLTAAAHRAFEDAALYRFMGQAEEFLDDLSNWYLRRSRRRFYSAETTADKEAAYGTLYETLLTFSRLLAPILPFLSEEMYQNLVCAIDPEAPDSVHLTRFPEVREERIDEDLEARIGAVIRLKNLGLSLRSEAQVKTRQPLGSLLVRPRDAAERAVMEDPELTRQVLEEINVKALQPVADEGAFITSSVKPNFKVLGPKHGRHMKAIGAHLAQTDAAVLQSAFENHGSYQLELGGETLELIREDIQLEHQGPDHLTFTFDQGTFAALDTTLTPELEQEGIARDFNRQGQEQRKGLDLAVTDRVTVQFSASERVREAVETHLQDLCQELLADSIEAVEEVDAEAVKVKVAGEVIALRVQKSS